MDHFVVENKQKQHSWRHDYLARKKKKTQINSVSRFENRTKDSEIWLKRQLYSARSCRNYKKNTRKNNLLKKRVKFFATSITWL